MFILHKKTAPTNDNPEPQKKAAPTVNNPELQKKAAPAVNNPELQKKAAPAVNNPELQKKAAPAKDSPGLQKKTAPANYNPGLFYQQCQTVIAFLFGSNDNLLSDWTLAHLCFQVDSKEGKYLVTSQTVVPCAKTIELVDWASRLDRNHWDHELHPDLAKDALAAILLTFPFRPHTVPTEQVVTRFSLTTPWLKPGTYISSAESLPDKTLVAACNLTTHFIHGLRSCLRLPNDSVLLDLYGKTFQGIRLQDIAARRSYGQTEDHKIVRRFADPTIPPETKEKWFEAIAPAVRQFEADSENKPWLSSDPSQTILKAFNAALQIVEAGPPIPDFRPILATRYQKKMPPPEVLVEMKEEPPPPAEREKAPAKVARPPKPPTVAPAPQGNAHPPTATPAKVPEPKPKPTAEVVRLRVRRTLHWPDQDVPG